MLLTIRDETASGKVTHSLTLDVLDETVTVRELIRSRVYQEVDDYNRKLRETNTDPVAYSGLVKPTDLEAVLNSSKAAKSPIKYRGPNGETWSGGRGRKPQWVTQALQQGRDLEEFAVKNGR